MKKLSKEEKEELQKLKNKVEEAYLNYCENAFIKNKLIHSIENLSNMLSTEELNQEKKINRANELWNEQNIFLDKFLTNNNYVYLPGANSFYFVDNNEYKLIKEDDIHHNILSSLTLHEKLNQCKHKTKNYIIKTIKEKHLFSQTPNTLIVDNVVEYLQKYIFENKYKSILFLCIIGDFLLKKNTNYIYFINTPLKKVLNLIEENLISHHDFYFNISNNLFIVKYHENQDRKKYRLLFSESKLSTLNDIKVQVNKISVKLLVVSCYYSNLFENSEKYIEENKMETIFYNKVNYLSIYSNEEIIKRFLEQYVEKGNKENDFSITWKNMHFLWKLYLEQTNLPNMMYSSQLKDILKKNIDFNEENDSFISVTSKHLPRISLFLHFWEKNIFIYENEKEFLYELDINDIEIEELMLLYKHKTNQHLHENEIINIISHFFPSQVMIEDKCILNIKCYIWNKYQEVSLFFENYRSQPSIENNNDSKTPLQSQSQSQSQSHSQSQSQSQSIKMKKKEMISFEEIYKDYCIFYSKKNKEIPLLVSKIYFTKYIQQNLFEFIVNDTFVSISWFQS